MARERSKLNQREAPRRELGVTHQLSQRGRKDEGSDVRHFMYEKCAPYFQDPASPLELITKLSEDMSLNTKEHTFP